MLDNTDTLKSRTARSSMKLIRQSLIALRRASSDLTIEANIEATLRESEVLSTAIKRLSGFISESDPARHGKANVRPTTSTDVRHVHRVLSSIVEGRFCPDCDGVQLQ